MIANESHTQGKELTWLVGQRKSKSGWSHFTDRLPAMIERKLARTDPPPRKSQGRHIDPFATG